MPIVVTKMVMPRAMFICSDGKVFRNAKRASRHEKMIHIVDMFPSTAIEYSRGYRGKRYHLGKHMFLRCGIYHMILKNSEDSRTLNYFFRGIYAALGYPENEDYPMEFDLEIFYEEIPGVIMNNAQWRLYKKDGGGGR